LDKNLHRNAEALQLYQQAVKTEGQFEKYREWKGFADRRIRELQKIDKEFFSDGISGLVVDIRPVFLCQRNVARIREKTGRVYKS